MPESRAFSRRQLFRTLATVAGGALLTRLDWRVEAAPLHWLLQAPAPAADQLATMRAQMGAAPIQATQLGDNLTMLAGPGGNVVVLHGAAGKIVVDSFVQPAWPKLKESLSALGTDPVRTLIDTHWHFDHADNNANFRAMGAAVVAHANTTKRMSESHEMLGMRVPASPAAALPTQTFTNTQVIESNGEQLMLTAVPPAHTDTDIFVHYRKANVLHMGDVFFNGMYPFIDAGTGGSISGMVAGADRALTLTDAQTRFVPGHGPLADRAALTRCRDMLATIRDRVQKLKAAGRSLAEVQAAKPSAEFDAAWGKGMMAPNDFLAIVYGTL